MRNHHVPTKTKFKLFHLKMEEQIQSKSCKTIDPYSYKTK